MNCSDSSDLSISQWSDASNLSILSGRTCQAFLFRSGRTQNLRWIWSQNRRYPTGTAGRTVTRHSGRTYRRTVNELSDWIQNLTDFRSHFGQGTTAIILCDFISLTSINIKQYCPWSELMLGQKIPYNMDDLPNVVWIMTVD